MQRELGLAIRRCPPNSLANKGKLPHNPSSDLTPSDQHSHRLPRTKYKVKGKRTLRILSWNIKGLYRTLTGQGQAGKLRELTDIMDRHKIDVLLLQETYVKGSPTYHTKDGQFLVAFSGEEPDPARPNAPSHSGVAAILNKKARNVLTDCTPISDRHMTLTFAAQGAPITIHNIYAPQSGRPLQERETFYAALTAATRHIHTRPTFFIGDWNTRLHRRFGTEHDTLGPHHYGDPQWSPQTPSLGSHSAEATNRELLLEYASSHELRVMNTFFAKPAHKQFTFKAPGPHSKFDPPVDSQGLPTKDRRGVQEFAQLDLAFCPSTWFNAISDVESKRDILALGSDYCPLQIDICLNLTRHRSRAPSRRPDFSLLLSTEERLTLAPVPLQRNLHGNDACPPPFRLPSRPMDSLHGLCQSGH